jgi:hypothetical protein
VRYKTLKKNALLSEKKKDEIVEERRQQFPKILNLERNE